MKNVTLTHKRNAALARAVNRKLVENPLMGVRTAVRLAVMEPVARGYFVSVDHVVNVDRARRAGKPLKMSASRSRMYDELLAAVDEYQGREGGTRLDAICHVLSHEPASRFFIDADYALKLFRRQKNLNS